MAMGEDVPCAGLESTGDRSEMRARYAHPHVSGGRTAVIHNGIIENYESIRATLSAKGYVFLSETDTEIIASLVHDFVNQGQDLTRAVRSAVRHFHGAYAIVVFDAQAPDRNRCRTHRQPARGGLGEGENFVASDVQALLNPPSHICYSAAWQVALARLD